MLSSGFGVLRFPPNKITVSFQVVTIFSSWDMSHWLKIQASAELCSFRKFLLENPFSCLFWLLEATHVPWLRSLPSSEQQWKGESHYLLPPMSTINRGPLPLESTGETVLHWITEDMLRTALCAKVICGAVYCCHRIANSSPSHSNCCHELSRFRLASS